MRTFITLEFTNELKNKIKEVQDFVRHNSLSGRFKHVDNFHLTLKFLGESTKETIDAINKDLTAELKNFGQLQLEFNGIGKFGTEENIKTVYIGVLGEIERLKKLQKKVDIISGKYGYKQEERYTPHITIAQNLELKIPFKDLCRDITTIINHGIAFNEVVIMKSEQIGKKRIYTPIEKICLGN